MRKTVWIIAVLPLAICLLLQLIKPPGDQRRVLQEQSEGAGNQQPAPSQPTRSQTGESAPAKVPKRPQGVGTSVVSKPPPGPPQTELSRLQERVLGDWQRVMDFYGKVVDQNGNAVPGANITFGWSEFPNEVGARRAKTKSDAQGLFSLHGKRGPALDIWVGKEGDFAAHNGQRGFSYSQGDFSPDPETPIVFTLRKGGTPAAGLLAMKRNYRIARDGTPIAIDLATGATSTGGSGNFVLRCWTQDQGKRPSEKYDWRCTLAVPGGGLLLTDEELVFWPPRADMKRRLKSKWRLASPIG